MLLSRVKFLKELSHWLRLLEYLVFLSLFCSKFQNLNCGKKKRTFKNPGSHVILKQKQAFCFFPSPNVEQIFSSYIFISPEMLFSSNIYIPPTHTYKRHHPVTEVEWALKKKSSPASFDRCSSGEVKAKPRVFRQDLTGTLLLCLAVSRVLY